MSEPFIGEIRPFPYVFVPQGWLPCAGQKESIVQYQALYALLGNRYGPTDNKTYFTVPNLQGFVPVHPGPSADGLLSWQVGKSGGSVSVALSSVAQLPAHNHPFFAATSTQGLPPYSATPGPTMLPSLVGPQGQALAAYGAQPDGVTTLAAGMVGGAGTAVPAAHENRQPFLVLTFCIATTGVFPTPS